MSKKRYTLYLSRPLARKFDQIAKLRNGAKSALVEEALKANLEPQQHPGIEEGLARRLNDLNKAVTAVGREVAVGFLHFLDPLPCSRLFQLSGGADVAILTREMAVSITWNAMILRPRWTIALLWRPLAPSARQISLG
jgi:hypothetical protein